MGKSVPVGEGWRLKVVSVTPNVNGVVYDIRLGTGRVPVRVPAGAQDYMVFLVATYKGGGSAGLLPLSNRTNFVRAHKVVYNLTLNDCIGFLPRPDLQDRMSRTAEIYSGITARGNVCVQVAKNDARTLRMYVERGDFGNRKRVWFALHKG